jgi:uncharacterized small protein (DUF1192 family)
MAQENSPEPIEGALNHCASILKASQTKLLDSFLFDPPFDATAYSDTGESGDRTFRVFRSVSVAYTGLLEHLCKLSNDPLEGPKEVPFDVFATRLQAEGLVEKLIAEVETLPHSVAKKFDLTNVEQIFDQTLKSDSGQNWGFWQGWRNSILRKSPLDWDLQRRVALIPDDIWNAGPEAVAEEIARIEAQWQSEQASQTSHAPEFEPDSVAHLFQYPQSVTASVNHISVNISQQFEVFRSETGLNETPELLKPLEAIPTCLDRIGDILTNHGHNATSEQQLREEIGRLQKRVAQLEAELQLARSNSDSQKTHWFGPALRVIGTSMSAIAISAWVISEDDLGPRKRIENILNWTKELSELATGAKPTSTPTLPQLFDT